MFPLFLSPVPADDVIDATGDGREQPTGVAADQRRFVAAGTDRDDTPASDRRTSDEMLDVQAGRRTASVGTDAAIA